MVVKRMKIGKKTYTRRDQKITKKKAQSKARKYRTDEGCSARVLPYVEGGWSVWTRKCKS